MFGQSCPENVGIGVVQVVEGRQGPPPAVVCGVEFAGVLVGVAEADERVGLGMAAGRRAGRGW
jgi:hypothetical protein